MKTWVKYIVEVFVIVFSILGAFWLEDWGEEKRRKELELRTLLSLESDLSVIIEDIDRDIKLHNLSLNSARFIVNYLEGKSSMSDSLINSFEVAYLDYRLANVDATYQSMQSHGIDLISNFELRNSIIEFYEFVIPWMLRVEENGRHFHNLLFPYYQKHFKANTKIINNTIDYDITLGYRNQYMASGFIPNNESFVRADPEFLLLLREVIYDRTQILKYYKETGKILAYELKDELAKEIETFAK